MDEKKIASELLSMGLIAYSEQETARDIIKRCLLLGMPMAGAGFWIGGKAGTVAVPGIGTVSGALVGALVGLASGTGACVALNYSVRNELKNLVHDKLK